MTAGVLERPVCQESLLGGGETLEELLNSALHEARANGTAECPVCHAASALTRAGAREAECRRCGSHLG